MKADVLEKTTVRIHPECRTMLDRCCHVYGLQHRVINAALIVFDALPRTLQTAAVIEAARLEDPANTPTNPGRPLAEWVADVHRLVDEVTATPNASATPTITPPKRRK